MAKPFVLNVTAYEGSMGRSHSIPTKSHRPPISHHLTDRPSQEASKCLIWTPL